MALEELLLPGEAILYRSPCKVKMGSEKYEIITTDRRFILYRQKGTLFRREEFKASSLPEITGISYKEEGLFPKKGIVQINLGRKVMTYSGRASPMKTVYSELQGYTIHAKDR